MSDTDLTLSLAGVIEREYQAASAFGPSVPAPLALARVLHREVAAALLASVEALIETLPRNEFGDEHYLAVEAAYANAVLVVRGAEQHTTQEDK